MKKTLFLALCAIALSVTSCVSVNNNKAAASQMPPAVTHRTHYRTITEIGKERVSAEVTGKTAIKIISWGLPENYADNGAFSGSDSDNSVIPSGIISKLPFMGDPYADYKKAAVYIACEENGCDSLLDCQYLITKKSYIKYLPFYEEITCKVTGYPVKITGHEQLEFSAISGGGCCGGKK